MANQPVSEIASLLRWLAEAGADETIAETPLDRLNVRPTTAPSQTKAEAPLRPPSMPRRAEAPATNMDAAAEAVSRATAPGAARALAASCTTLAELKAAISKFDSCELRRLATNTVFADGTPNGRIMLIGEAPGRDEDLQGLPFVGRAGQLLDKMLAAINLDRNKVYITNVLPWRPPQNRDPSPEEAAACLPFLHRHIELAKPELMMLLGAVSVRHVLGITDGIMRRRGKWEIYQSAGRTIPVMPTLHPAFLLRQPASKRLAWHDMLAVAEKIEQLGLVQPA